MQRRFCMMHGVAVGACDAGGGVRRSLLVGHVEIARVAVQADLGLRFGGKRGESAYHGLVPSRSHVRAPGPVASFAPRFLRRFVFQSKASKVSVTRKGVPELRVAPFANKSADVRRLRRRLSMAEGRDKAQHDWRRAKTEKVLAHGSY
jgi:hypothetical protein